MTRAKLESELSKVMVLPQRVVGVAVKSWSLSRAIPASMRFLIVLIAVSAILGVLRFHSIPVGKNNDDASYIILAESIASGQGYRLINFPHAPPEEAFPPGWPLLLAPFVSLFPGSYASLPWLSLLFWLASIPLMYRLFAAHVKSPTREIAITLAALNPLMVRTGVTVMSEAAYLFFSLLTLNLFELWEKRRGQSNTWWIAVAVIVTLLYTQLIRSIGLSILLAIVVYLLLARRVRLLVMLSVVILLGLLPQIVLNSQQGGGLTSPSYASAVLNMASPQVKLAQMADNLQRYIDNQVIANILVPIFSSRVLDALANVWGALNWTLVLSTVNLLLLGMVLGGFLLLLRPLSIISLYTTFYFFAVLAFWYPDGLGVKPRLLIPLIPFFYLYLCKAVIWVGVRARRVRYTYRIAATTATLLLALVLLAQNLQETWEEPTSNGIADVFASAVWLQENAPADAVIMVRDPGPVYLYARRQTVEYPSALWEAEPIKAYTANHSVDYILVAPALQPSQPDARDDFVQQALLPLLASEPDIFRLVHLDDEKSVAIYAVDADALAMDRGE